jgi:acetylornithine/N-succinyldiaminopimelate aminotransferase
MKEKLLMTAEIMQTSDKVFAKTYARFPVVFEKGGGCALWDTEGKKYIDFMAGIAVCNLGHAHPRIAKALSRQAETLLHVSNLYYTVPQTQLAELLVQNSFADRVFLCNSGAEANEAAIKLTRKFFQDKGDKKRFRILSMERSFHGRTMASLSATGQDKIKKGFDPVLAGFDFVPFNDIAALEAKIDESVGAVMLEPIQGEGGVNLPAPGYLQAIRQLCDQKGCLLIFDEIQTGMGRTGKLFAYEHFGVTPDIMTLAKALGNGLPIGAMLTKEHIAESFGPGAHASTFGGTPVVTAAALETLKIMIEEKVAENAAKTGDYFVKQLHTLKERHAVIKEIRGMGLLIGMELSVKGAPIVTACLQNGFVINCIQEQVLRFIPPLIITREMIDALVVCLDNIFTNLD